MSRKSKQARSGKRTAGPAAPDGIPKDVLRQAIRNIALFASRAPTRDMAESDARAQSIRIAFQAHGIPLQELTGGNRQTAADAKPAENAA